jgi:hypothetical protein
VISLWGRSAFTARIATTIIMVMMAQKRKILRARMAIMVRPFCILWKGGLSLADVAWWGQFFDKGDENLHQGRF